MFAYFDAIRHLGGAEFIDLLEGAPLAGNRRRHLERCSRCQATFESVALVYGDIAGIDQDGWNAVPGAELADVDWDRLRSSVRDHLLARSVKRSSNLQRWTGGTLTPLTARAMAGVLLLFVTVGSLWHYRTAHTPAIARFAEPQPLNAFAPESAENLLGDPDVLAAEALAWPETEIFTALNQLEAGEEETLRELIAMALADDIGGNVLAP